MGTPQISAWSVDNEFVLPPGVLLLQSDSLPAEVRLSAGISNDDLALTRPGGRGTSVVIAVELGQLVEEFRQPTTIIDAIIRYAHGSATDPLEVFDESMPALQELMKEGFLIPRHAWSQEGLRPTFRRGDRLGRWEVVSCVQCVEDTELYCGRSPGRGSPVAIKTLRTAARAQVEMLKREAASLRHIHGPIAPSLLDQGEKGEIPYFVMEWCEGVPCTIVADECRSAACGRSVLARLCTDIVRAYEMLHAQGVVHGDVHPNNILVASDGQVRLVDFGLAVAPDQVVPSRRGGVGFFYEPELARARLAAAREPSCTPAGEQYAVAALLYLLITGSHYVDFSLLEHDALVQIRDIAPTSFAARGIEEWPSMEEALGRALAKRPDERYESMSAFVVALDRRDIVTSRPTNSERVAVRDSALSRHPFVASMLARTRPEGPLLANLDMITAPRASLFYGTGGIAYGLYRLGCLRGDARELRNADLWLQRAYQMGELEGGFLNPEYGVTRGRVSMSCPFHSMAGLNATQALLSGALGDLATRSTAIDEFVRESVTSVDQMDLTLGRAGTLLTAALLLDASDGDFAAQTSLTTLGDAVCAEVLQSLGKVGSIATSHDLNYIGIAHGWAGVLFAALRWFEVTEREIPADLCARLGELAEWGEPSGRGLRWSIRNAHADPDGEEGYLSGWCNGSAGLAQLWCLASRLSSDEVFIDLATRAAWHVWETPTKLSNLCCGAAGEVYALLAVGERTGDVTWLDRARRLATSVARDTKGSPFPDSLLKGAMGQALALCDLDAPENAAMPFFSREHP